MKLSYRWGIVFAAVLLALWGLAPTILDVAADGTLDRDFEVEQEDGTTVRNIDNAVADWVMATGTPLTLGLDLQGGLLLQYKVLLEKAVQDKLDRMAQDVETGIEERGDSIKATVEHPDDTYRIEVNFEDPGKISEVLDADFMANYTNLEKVPKSDGLVYLKMTEDYVEETKKFAVKQAVETIRERVNSLGVTEPSITRRGESDIVVQLPGLEEEDQERAKELIGQTARLRFRLVENVEGTNEFFNKFRDELPTEDFKLRRIGDTLTLTHPNKERLKEFFDGRVDDEHLIGYKYMPVYKDKEEEEIDEEKSYWRTYYLFSETRLTGDRVQNARVTVDQRSQEPVVSLTLDRQGAEKFRKLTAANVDERFAIMLDDEVQSAPVIREEIPGGRAQISMGSMQSYAEIQQEAQDLVIVLRHGALPAPIELQYQTAVGPTLGQESIDSSVKALILGSILIILFMLIYYRFSGLISVLALLLNMLFVVSALAGLGATLTLPGIAGIILTVGMAVDANVIIFERVREEVRHGSSPREAVDAGFGKALSAVIDANVTTGIAALVLMQYGTGPIRGFAVTLLIGIVGTIFTAVFCSRTMFDTWLSGEDARDTLSI